MAGRTNGAMATTLTEPGRVAPNARVPAREGARSETPLSIAHVVAPAPFGGLERVVHALAEGQQRRGHRAAVLAVVEPSEGEHPFVATLRAAGVPVETIMVSGRAYREERRRVADYCRRHRVDILHTHGYRPDVIDAPVARRLGIARVSTVHGFTGNGWKNRMYEWLQVRAYRRFDGVIAVAQAQVERLVDGGARPERVHVLPNAWREEAAFSAREAREKLGVPPEAFHIGWVGRLSLEKTADQLLEGAALVKELPFAISIIGDGPQREALEMRAAELGIADRVRWHGAVEGAGRYFPAFDLFALSSRTEGTPIVLFEAMANRVPVVAYAVGGVPNVISPAEGILAEPRSPASLAAGIRSVFEQRTAAAERAERARKRLESEFSLDAWLDRHDEIYWKAVGR